MSFEFRSVDENLDEFYAGSSVMVPNKFMVYLDGEYLTRAINNMERAVNANYNYPVDRVNFYAWKSAHVSTGVTSMSKKAESIQQDSWGGVKSQRSIGTVQDSQWGGVLSQRITESTDTAAFAGVEYQTSNQISSDTSTGYKLNFLWACRDISLPLVTIGSDVDELVGMSLDSIRNLKYTLVTDYTMDESISMTVHEQKGMIWYHFFNELGNLFFDTKLLTPRDSIQKLRMRIDTLIMQDQPRGDIDTAYVAPASAYELGQQFEFNSIVYTGNGNLALGQDNTTPMTHNISFKVPNPFQKAFKHDITGMSMKLHDDQFVSGYALKTSEFENNIPDSVQKYEDFITDDSRADN